MTSYSYNDGFPRFLDHLGSPNFVKDMILKAPSNLTTESFGNGTYLWVFERVGKLCKIVCYENNPSFNTLHSFISREGYWVHLSAKQDDRGGKEGPQRQQGGPFLLGQPFQGEPFLHPQFWRHQHHLMQRSHRRVRPVLSPYNISVITFVPMYCSYTLLSKK